MATASGRHRTVTTPGRYRLATNSGRGAALESEERSWRRTSLVGWLVVSLVFAGFIALSVRQVRSLGRLGVDRRCGARV